MNREQRRRQQRQGKPQGMTYGQQLARKQFLKSAAQQAVKDTTVQVEADIRVQRAMWLMCVAMNDAFGIGKDRFERFAACLQERTDWYEQMCREGDEEYANEKLRREASRISGIEIKYLYEHEIQP